MASSASDRSSGHEYRIERAAAWRQKWVSWGTHTDVSSDAMRCRRVVPDRAMPAIRKLTLGVVLPVVIVQGRLRAGETRGDGRRRCVDLRTMTGPLCQPPEHRNYRCEPNQDRLARGNNKYRDEVHHARISEACSSPPTN